jgi:Ca2+-binding EF-hand superfamily protein
MLHVRLGTMAVLVLLLAAITRMAAEEPRSRTGDKTRPSPEAQGESLPLSAEQLLKEYDRNGDGFLEREEVSGRLRERFNQLDANHDGRLSREELQKGMALLLPHRRPSDIVYVLIEMSDCDDECACEIQTVYDVLRQLDTNHNGKIDPDELKAMRERLLDERVDQRIKDLDTNHDGKISRDEARGRIKQDFDRIDANRDGIIDRDELRRASAQRVHADGKAASPADKGEHKR